jgi:hypothetical protein
MANTVQGLVSDLRREAIAGGTRTTFHVHAADGNETHVETRLDFPYKNGDQVRATGELNSDLVLMAVSIAPVAVMPPLPRHFPWKWVISAVALIAIAFLVKSMLSKGSTLTVTANNCGKAAPNAQIRLTSPNGVSTPCTADASSKCVFRELKAGTYTILASVERSQRVVVDGKNDLSIAVNLTSPMYCIGIIQPRPPSKLIQKQ